MLETIEINEDVVKRVDKISSWRVRPAQHRIENLYYFIVYLDCTIKIIIILFVVVFISEGPDGWSSTLK